MAKCNPDGVPYSGRKGNASYYRSIHGLIVRICSNAIPKGRKPSEKQRLIQLAWANLIILWRMFCKMLQPTFSLRPETETACNAFVRANWKRAQIFLTKEMVQNGACIVTPCEINHGDLAPRVLYWKDSSADWMVTNLLLGDLVIDENTTVGQLSTALIKCNDSVFREGAKNHYLDFFCAQQRLDADTHFPTVNVIGHTLCLDKKSVEKLWEVTGGSEGFQSYKGHLATPYQQFDLYAWVRLEQSANDKYSSTTQSLMGDNTSTIARYSSKEAFDEACASYGGFSQKFLIPFKAKIPSFHYDLQTYPTEAGKNPDVMPDGELGSTGGSGSQGGGDQGGSTGGSGSQGGGNQGGGGSPEIDM